MARLSKEKRIELDAYIDKLCRQDNSGILLSLSHFCGTSEQVDAVRVCISWIDEERVRYLNAKESQPHDKNIRKRAWDTLLGKAKNQQSREEIYLELKDTFPLYSEILTIRNEIIDDCKGILKGSGMGKIKIRKIIGKPDGYGLMEYLMNPEYKKPVDPILQEEIRVLTNRGSKA